MQSGKGYTLCREQNIDKSLVASRKVFNTMQSGSETSFGQVGRNASYEGHVVAETFVQKDHVDYDEAFVIGAILDSVLPIVGYFASYAGIYTFRTLTTPY